MSDAQDLFAEVQAVLAGHSEAAVMQVVLRSLLVVIGVSAPGLGRAEALIEALPAELIPMLRAEWPNYRAHRARASVISYAPRERRPPPS